MSSEAKPARDGEVLLGEVVGVFGIRGEVRLHLHHRESVTLVEPRIATLVSPTGERREVRLRVRSGAGRRVLGCIDGVTTPEAAATLHGWAIVIDRAALPPTAKDEFYVHDLLGLAVVDEDGEALGEIVDVVAGDRDVWVVETGSKSAFVIASPENIRDVDVGAGRVIIRTGSLAHQDE